MGAKLICFFYTLVHFLVFWLLEQSQGSQGVGFAILVTVIVFGPSDPLGVSKMSTVTGIVGVGVTILVTVIVFGPSDPLEVSRMPTVAGIRSLKA